MSLLYDLAKELQKRRLEKIQFLAAVLITLFALGVNFFQIHQKDKLREQNFTYDKQLEVLTQVQASIDNLKEFVGTQKKKLQEQQSVLEALKTEKEKLRPVVEADRQVVEALLRVQAEHNRASIWTDRLIGFLLGVVSSLIASIIWSAIRLRRSNKLLKATAAAPGS